MADFSEKIQDLMDAVYDAWNKEENKGKGKWDVLNGFSAAHQIAVTFGNFNNQVGNGGIEQWIYNGYFHDDAEKFTEYLEIGAETDERCRSILDKVYKLDQYAQETGCDRNGNYRDEDGESNFIGEMINGDAFDTWYYANCGKEDWWELVSGIIDKAEERGLAPVVQHEQDTGDANIKPPLQVYIWNVHDDRIGGFTMPLPATMEELQPFLDGAEITGWQDVEILEVSSDISGLGEALTENIRKTMTKDALDELNYLAARIEALQGGNGHDMFAAAVETKRYNGSVAEIINLTFDENLNRFDLLPAFTDEQYGEFLLDFGGDEHADAFNRLDNSDAEGDVALARYIEKLEKYADKAAYGRVYRNIKKSVKYVYYIPDNLALKKDFEDFRKQISARIYQDKVSEGYPHKTATKETVKLLEDGLILLCFKESEDEFLYNYSYMISADTTVFSCWYISDQNYELPIENDNNVLLIPLLVDENEKLRKVFLGILQSNGFGSNKQKFLIFK